MEGEPGLVGVCVSPRRACAEAPLTFAEGERLNPNPNSNPNPDPCPTLDGFRERRTDRQRRVDAVDDAVDVMQRQRVQQ